MTDYNPEKINLYHIKISLPVSFEDGSAKAYTYKSIGDIINDEDWFELCRLEDWVSRQFIDFVGLDLLSDNKQSIIDSMGEVFSLFHQLGIKPVDCIYDEDII